MLEAPACHARNRRRACLSLCDISGALLHSQVRARADDTIRLSKMVLNHQIARCVAPLSLPPPALFAVPRVERPNCRSVVSLAYLRDDNLWVSSGSQATHCTFRCLLVL